MDDRAPIERDAEYLERVISGARDPNIPEDQPAAPNATAGDPGGDDWSEPVPFDALATPEIPASLLPDPVGAYVGALAAHTETPPALGVIVALAVLSTATRGRVLVELNEGYLEP